MVKKFDDMLSRFDIDYRHVTRQDILWQRSRAIIAAHSKNALF